MLYFTKAKRWNFILFGILWFFAFLVSSFIHPDPSLVSNFIEHRLYVPIIGIFIILLETDFVKNIDFKKKSTLILSGGLILLFIVITIVHSRNFVDRMAFWKDAAETSPDSAFVHNNLGAMYYLDGDMNDAGKEFQKAIEINPSEPMANNNLGLVYMSENKLADAETEYKKELEVNPNYDNAYFNLGLLYWQEKNYTNAEINWKKTLEVNPDFIDAINALAVSYYVQKDYKNAIPYASELYQMGINLPPEILQMLQNQ
jgi:tetratricopeptide (TPR) repeat protein